MCSQTDGLVVVQLSKAFCAAYAASCVYTCPGIRRLGFAVLQLGLVVLSFHVDHQHIIVSISCRRQSDAVEDDDKKSKRHRSDKRDDDDR